MDNKKKEIYERLTSENKKTVMALSIKGILLSLKAEKVIYSSGKGDVNQYFINGAKTIQTWHGAPMKKIGLDNKLAYKRHKYFILKYLFPFIYEYNQDYVVSTANVFNDKLCSAFDISPDRIILTGYPRNDIFSQDYTHPLIQDWNSQFHCPKIIIYLPTFRSETDNFRPFDEFNFNENKWHEFLEKTNSILVSKGHFVDKCLQSKSSSKRIIHLSDKLIDDLNPLLKDTDILITDYSGVYFDFLLTRRPIILAPFDFEKYISNSRELYFDYFNDIIGPKCYNWDEVLICLKENRTIDYSKSLKKFNKFSDDMSTERLYRTIVERKNL